MPQTLPWPSACAAVVPVYNHGESVGMVIRQLQHLGASVLCIDDGSQDQSYTAACATGARVERLRRNCGKGVALRHAAQLLAGEGWQHMCTIDADGQHPPTAACHLARMAQQDAEALWIGARTFPASTPLSSRLGRACCNLGVRLLCRQHPGDVQSGLRVYPLGQHLWQGHHAQGYGFEVEIVVAMMRQGVRVCPVRVPVHYPPERISHFQPWKDSLRTAGIMLRLFT